MRPSPTLLLAVLAASPAALPGQNTTVDLPTLPAPIQNNNLPFAGGVIRYQQWHSPQEMVMAVAEPRRVLQVDFLAGPSGLQTVTTVDVEITMAHGPASSPSGIFDSNLQRDRTVVFPRSVVSLRTGTPANVATMTPGGVVISFPFANVFTWDGQSSVVLDIRVFGNGRGNSPFNFDFQSTANSLGKIARLWSVGNASAPNASMVQLGWGLFTRFTLRPGTMLPYGNGCPGAGGFVPAATAAPLAQPGVVWTHTVSNAASQRLALLVLGDSRTMWGAQPLPLDLGTTFVGATGCDLLANPVHTLITTTVGGGPGGGIGTVSISIPPITTFVGLSVYTQWLVDDPLSRSGVLSATGGLWHVVAPAGG